MSHAFKACLQNVYAGMADDLARSLNGMSREEWDRRKRADRNFWAQHPGAQAACLALGDLAQSQRAALLILRAQQTTGARRLVLLQMASEDVEDHAPGDDEWVLTALSADLLRELAEHAYPYGYRCYGQTKLLSTWLCELGVAAMATDVPEHLEY